MSKTSIQELCERGAKDISSAKPWRYFSVIGAMNVADDFKEFLIKCEKTENNDPVEIVLTSLYYLKQSCLLQGLDSTFFSSDSTAEIAFYILRLIKSIFINPLTFFQATL